MAGILDGLNDAKVFEQGQFLSPDAHYELQVDKILAKKTRKSGTCFIVEATVLKSTSEKDPVGSKRTWLQKLDPVDVAFPAIKSFMYALLGYNFQGVDKEFCVKNIDPQLTKEDGTGLTDQALSDKQPFKGRKVGVDTVQVKTVGKGLNFTRHNFFPIDAKLGQTSA